jgi:Spy/CpxP family protein refolding chaperone
MKNIICLIVFILGISFVNNAEAQEKRQAAQQLTPEQRAEKRTELLKAKLLLNDDQTSKVKAAALKVETQRSSDREKSLEARQTFDNEVKAILDPEQLEKYEAMKDQRRTQVKKRVEDRNNQEKLNSTETEEGQKDSENKN